MSDQHPPPRAMCDAYLAGWIDGEGSLGLYSQSRKGNEHAPTPRLTATNTDRDVLIELAATFGGNVYPKKRYDPAWAPTWQWNVGPAETIKLIRRMLPHLRTKRSVAIKILEIADIPALHRGRPKGWRPGEPYKCNCDSCESVRDRRRRLIAEITELNRRGA